MGCRRKFYLFIFIIIGFNIASLFPKTYSLFQFSKQVDGSIVVPENNYCINNGFDKLSDCVLVMENYSDNVDSAKSYISSKKVASFGRTAPTIAYQEVKTDLVDTTEGIFNSKHHLTLGKSYTFNTSTGIYYLKDTVDSVLTDDYIDYYTCGDNMSTWDNCANIYQVKAYEVQDGTYKITKAVKHSYSVVDALDSEIGLYAAEDDLGTSYYYRGNVKNNFVKFAGYVWKIVRVNGNGTVRLIYSGTSTDATGSGTQIGLSAYNNKTWDPTYVGYKYGEDFTLNTTNTEIGEYNNFKENTSYYFGSTYTFDESTKKFQLSGDLISGKFKDVHNPVNSDHSYTCFNTASDGTCDYLVQIKEFSNNYTAKVSFISYSSKSYEATLKNTTDSTIKGAIETWYEEHLLNQYDDYLSDETFCNDRSVSSGSGYKLTPTTFYGASDRVYTHKTPSLKCSQSVDKFTKTSGILKYPIGLITADEVSYAGGVCNQVNARYYLHTGNNYWTFSPSRFNSSNAITYVWFVEASGSANPWYYASAPYGVRPVINLKADVVISGGDGTAINPYVVKLDR